MKYLCTLWILVLTLNCTWGSPVIYSIYKDIDAPIEFYSDSRQEVVMQCQKSMHTFTNLLQHIASTNKQMREFLQSIDDPSPARRDNYSSGIFNARNYVLIWPRVLTHKNQNNSFPYIFELSLIAHGPPIKYDDEYYLTLGSDLLIHDLTNSVTIEFMNANREESLNRMLKNCILEAFPEFDRYMMPSKDNLKGEQPLSPR